MQDAVNEVVAPKSKALDQILKTYSDQRKQMRQKSLQLQLRGNL